MPHSIESIASTRKKTKETIRIESLVPLELREKAQTLIELLRDYYAHINESGQASYAINKINDQRNIDIADAQYLDLIQKEIAVTIPKNTITDRVTLYKNLMRYYSLRGSQESVELFFKILFNDNVELYYPKDSMLIPSSGTWDAANTRSAYIGLLDQTKESTFQLQLVPGGSGTGTLAIGEKILGITSGAESIIRSIDGDILTVDGITTGADQFEKNEILIGETTLELNNFTIGESVSGAVSTATATVAAVINDYTIDITPVNGLTFLPDEPLTSAAPSNTHRKISELDTIYTIALNTYSVGNTIEGQISGATGTISAISTNVLDITYNAVDSRNAPTPAFFVVGETIAATSGTSANVREITAINNKITFDVTSASGFAVNDIISGANSGARGKIESITSNTIVVTEAIGAFRNGENVVKDLNPSGVYSDITNTPVAHAFLTLSTFAVGDTVVSSSGNVSGIVIDSQLTSITVGSVSGVFTVGDVISGGAGVTLARKATSVSRYIRVILNNFVVGEIVTDGTASGKVVSVYKSVLRLQNVTNGPFTVGNNLSGATSSTLRDITDVTDGAERAISAIYKNGALVYNVSVSSESGPFTIGETVTGSSSAEFAKVTAYQSGLLTLTNPSGNFIRGESLTGSSSGETATVIRSYTQGGYTSNLGFLDDTIKIQDSYFYQKFSYVIRTGNNVDIWKNAFNRLVHPAGFIFFGEILLLIELLGMHSVMPRIQPGMIYDEDIPLLILIDGLFGGGTLADTVYRMALDVPTGTSDTFMLKFFDANPMSMYGIMTIQEADGFAEESPVGPAYAWDDYTIADVINNEITWNDVILGVTLT